MSNVVHDMSSPASPTNIKAMPSAARKRSVSRLAVKRPPPTASMATKMTCCFRIRPVFSLSLIDPTPESAGPAL